MPRQVTVACNLPNGLILQNCVFREENVPVMGGGFRLEKIGRKIGPAVTVFGVARAFGAEPATRIVAGYAMTYNVDGDFWDEWLKQNAESDMVKNKCIFAFDKKDDAEHEAKELRQKSGLQPMDMSMTTVNGKQRARDARVPRANVAGGVALDITGATKD